MHRLLGLMYNEILNKYFLSCYQATRHIRHPQEGILRKINNF